MSAIFYIEAAASAFAADHYLTMALIPRNPLAIILMHLQLLLAIFQLIIAPWELDPLISVVSCKTSSMVLTRVESSADILIWKGVLLPGTEAT
ncbi:hypothetical protein C8J56DRAFT_1057830 [Mycena floridula]|nr:hypothetical protein C8J56DRAFT_1057830 [Mycena floridula]